MAGRRSSTVLFTGQQDDLDRVRDKGVPAVVYVPDPIPTWLSDVASAVEGGGFAVARATLDSVGASEIAQWLETNLSTGIVSRATRENLIADIHSMACRVAQLSRSDKLLFRIHTDAPDRRCGFHVDAVLPGTPPWGLLRVYNGAGTSYVESDNVASMAGFYRYLGRRERIIRELADPATRSGGGSSPDVLLADLDQLDGELPFLVDSGAIGRIPAGAVVAFTHLDLQHMWSNHSPDLAWIHCSPMTGAPRLVVNISPSPRALCRTVQAADETAR